MRVKGPGQSATPRRWWQSRRRPPDAPPSPARQLIANAWTDVRQALNERVVSWRSADPRVNRVPMSASPLTTPGSSDHAVSPEPTRTRAYVLFALLVVILGVSLAVPGGDNDNEVVLPDDLLGVWRTSAPKYQESFFEISERRLVFGTGSDHREVHEIDRATLSTDPRGSLYTVWYRIAEDEALPQSFRFYYAAEQGVLRFEHQQNIVWHNVRPRRDLMEIVREIERLIAGVDEP